jgi:hypothetical protein
LEVGAVGGGGESAVGDPHHARQVRGSQVVFDGENDALVTVVAGEGPAAHRGAVAGDRHRDDHLRQVVAVVFGLAERAGGVFGRLADTVAKISEAISPRASSRKTIVA